MGANKIRIATLSLGLISGGVGGVAPDFDHFLSTITQGQIPWAFLHTPLVAFILLGCALTLSLGLYWTLVLRRFNGLRTLYH